MPLSFSSRIEAPKPGGHIKPMGESECGAHPFDARTGKTPASPAGKHGVSRRDGNVFSLWGEDGVIRIQFGFFGKKQGEER
ncbi:MAG: hypothetical protein LBU64_14150 [Planctomycetota bacterium]|jgi:hypothetical protein|nr:hypothetical protein [Planctomycetota bacterium]